MLTVQEVVGPMNNLKAVVEAARPNCPQEAAEAGSHPLQVPEEAIVADHQLPLAGNTDSMRRSFGSRHKQHKDLRLVDWRSIEPIGLHNP